MAEASGQHLQAIEQPEGPPTVKPVETGEVEASRKAVYLSYESFLR